MNLTKEHKDILSFWHKIEFLTPKTLGFEAKLIIDKLPWPDAKTDEYFQLFIGVYNVKFAIDKLSDFFSTKDDNPNFNENAKFGSICINIDNNGVFYNEPENIGVSTFPWAVNQVLNNNLSNNWEAIFSYYENDIKDIVGSILEEGVNIDTIKKIEIQLSTKLEWFKDTEAKIYYQKKARPSKQKSSTKQEAEGDSDDDELQNDILNSFFISDLELLLKNNNVGEALYRYLNATTGQPEQRSDLIRNKELLNTILRPQNIPLSAWPSEFPISLMQQVAVNLAKSQEESIKHLFSVNGPPGTGKTTLLRDVIALNFFERAQKLAEYNNPESAFSELNNVQINNFTSKIYSIDKKLTNYSMVVASSNNGAVDNISKELPEKKSIPEYYASLPESEYFKALSDVIFEIDTWGLISVPLGNKKNRNNFANKFWIYNNYKDKEYLNFRKILENSSYTLTDWNNARKRFSDSVIKTKKIIDQYSNYAHNLDLLPHKKIEFDNKCEFLSECENEF